MAEHWHGKPKALGSIPGSSTFPSSPFFSHSKSLRTVMARLRSLIRPSLISPWTKLIGVPTIGLPAVITLKIPLNQQSYTATILIPKDATLMQGETSVIKTPIRVECVHSHTFISYHYMVHITPSNDSNTLYCHFSSGQFDMIQLYWHL